MSERISVIPERFRIARKYESVAMYPMYLGMAGIAVAAITQQIWLLIASPFVGMPSAWLFNIRCYRCAWPAYRRFSDPSGSTGADSMFARYAKPLRLPLACTKCGAPFIDEQMNSAPEAS